MYALIVDDEQRARDTIHQLIKMCCPQISKVQEADSVTAAVTSIQTQRPDLLLLDIQLGDGTGFDVLKQVDYEALKIIFVTAYDEYAIKAFKVSAVDYLLKPVDPDDLIEAIDRVQKQLAQDLLGQRMDVLLHQAISQHTKPRKITLKTAERVYVVSIDDIIYCAADKNYTSFFLTQQRQILVSKNLREYEALLGQEQFLRTHHSYLVNTKHIIEYDRGPNNCLLLTEGHQVAVSTRKKELVLQFLKQL